MQIYRLKLLSVQIYYVQLTLTYYANLLNRKMPSSATQYEVPYLLIRI